MNIATPLRRLEMLPAVAKAGIVAGGYVAAILLSACIVLVYIHQTGGPDRDLYSAMYGFGDFLLFIAVFGMVSTLPTGLALFFMRQSRIFWVTLCVLALAVAGTGLATIAIMQLTPQQLAQSASLNAWAMLAFPRFFVSPLIAALFGLSLLIAPHAGYRWCLLGAASAEGASSVYGFFHWFAPLLFH